MIGYQIGQQGGQETSGVIEKSCGWSKDLYISGPAKSLGALWAVAGNIQEVITHAPNDVLVEAVEERIRACEPADALQVRMTNHCT